MEQPPFSGSVLSETEAQSTPPMNETLFQTAEPSPCPGWRRWLQQQLLPTLLALLLGISVGYMVWGQKGTEDVFNRQGQPVAGRPDVPGTPRATPTLPRFEVSPDDDPAIGPENAPVLIIEFGDYECPYCKRWRRTVLDRLLQDFQGKIRVVYRDFPLTSIHPEALPAAIAANCAGEQGRYWEYHDLLFLGDLPLGHDTYLEYAKRLDLDMDTFQTCLKDEEKAQENEIMQDFQDGLRLGVQGTPTFFINGVPVVGAQPYEIFRSLIEHELQTAE